MNSISVLKSRFALVSVLLLGIFQIVPSLRVISGPPAPMPSQSQTLSYLHFLIGNIKSLDNDAKGALEHFQYAYHFDPASSTILLRQSEELINIGQNKSAGDLLDRIADDQNDNPEYFVLRSRIAAQDLDVSAAVKALDQALALFEKEDNFNKIREITLTKVSLLTDFRRYDDAIQSLEKYLATAQDDEIAIYFLGRVHSIFQNRDEAKKAFKRALAIRPGFVGAAKALGLQLELEGNLHEALNVYSAALRAGANDADLLSKLVNISLTLEEYSLALDYMHQSLILNPDDQQMQLKAGLIHYKLKEYDRAKVIFDTLLKSDAISHDRLHYYLGSIYQELADFDSSLKHFKNVLVSSEYYVDSRLQMAATLALKMNNSNEAVQVLKLGVAERPDSAELPVALASQLEVLSKLSESIRVLKEASDRFKDNERILFMLGTFLDRAGAFEESIERMKEVLKINPNNAHALNHIGYSLAERNIQLDEAEKHLKKAVQLAPDNGYILDSLALVYFKQGQLEKARNLLERANDLAPDEPVILEHLADTYRGMGRENEALVIYRRIMQSSKELGLTDNDSETKRVRQRVREKLAMASDERAQ